MYAEILYLAEFVIIFNFYILSIVEYTKTGECFSRNSCACIVMKIGELKFF